MKKSFSLVFIVLVSGFLTACGGGGGVMGGGTPGSTLSISPTKLTIAAAPRDPGTWYSEYFTLTLMAKSGKPLGNTQVTITSDSPYVKLFDGAIDKGGYMTVVTDPYGSYTLGIKYYVQTFKSPATNYVANIAAQSGASQAAAQITVAPPSASSYTIASVPSSLAYTTATTDGGTARTQQFLISIKDSDGYPVQDTLSVSWIGGSEPAGWVSVSPTAPVTDANGSCIVTLSFKTFYDSVGKQATSYSGSITVSYYNTTLSIPVTVQ